MLRVAIYARYSSDLQSDASIEDQIRLCQERIEKEGWTLKASFKDHGLSGATMLRPGIQELISSALKGEFDIVLAEALDRLSRDQEDIAGIYKRLSFAGIKLITLSEGEISTLHIGLKGTMNAQFLQDLADKTRRGLRGRVEKGRSGGGISYGYDVIKRFDANGEPLKGERQINQEQAAIVRRIFEEFAKGHSPKAIAHQLNREDIACPSGNDWGTSTIYGNRRRGTGILNNELYIGQLVWNRQRFIKNPDTGKRVARLNPENEWIRKELPELRIVDQDVWSRVKAKQRELDERPAFHQKQRPKNLLSYLLQCSECGGGFSKVSKTHYGCSTARNKGTCENRRTIAQDFLEGSILDALEFLLMREDLVEVFCAEYTAHRNRLRRESQSQALAARTELDKLAREKDRLIQAIRDGVPASVIKDALEANEARRNVLEAQGIPSAEEPVLLHPSMAKRYRDEVTALREGLKDPTQRTETAALVRKLIDRIVLSPKPGPKGLIVDLYGDLAGILRIAVRDAKKNSGLEPLLSQIELLAANDNALDHHSQQAKVVAGASTTLFS